MEIIEFLQKTEQKNIKSYIGLKVVKGQIFKCVFRIVKEKLKEYEKALDERRLRLRNMLEFEDMQYEEEIILLLNEKLEEQFQKRLDWINTKSLERIKAEEELLKLKNQQRELENSEAWRHMQSKELLLETKEAQLYQIKEKKLKYQKEKQIEKQWLAVMKRLNQEREYQEIYENKLRKVIEGSNREKNKETCQNTKRQQQLEIKQLQKDGREETEKLLVMDEKLRQEQHLKKILNKTQQHDFLKNQIALNNSRRHYNLQKSLEEAVVQKELEDQEILIDLAEAKRQKVRNKEWEKHYLKNSLKEKLQKSKEELEFEKLYLNTGCVLQQTSKKPYGKYTR